MKGLRVVSIDIVEPILEEPNLKLEGKGKDLTS